MADTSQGETQGGPARGDRKERRRTQGREAQRRFRMRKDQAIQDLQAENDILQDIIEEMGTTFLQFGDRLWSTGLLAASIPLASEWMDSLRKMLGLAEKAHKTTMPDKPASEPVSASAGLGPGSSNSNATGYFDVPQNTSSSAIVPSHFPLNTTDSDSLHHLSMRMRELTERTSVAISSLIPATESISPGAIRMPTLNPVMAEDYLDPEWLSKTNISFAKRLVRAGLVRAYKSLELQRWGALSDSNDPYKTWQSGFFKYSLPTTTSVTLFHRIRMAIKSLMTEDEDSGLATPTPATSSAAAVQEADGLEYKRLRLAWHFNNIGDQRIGLETRQLMSADGVAWEHLLDAEQVEDYLVKSGFVWANELEVKLSILPSDPTMMDVSAQTEPEMVVADQASATASASTSASISGVGEQVVATVDVEVLIEKLVDSSLCLGNSIGYWRHMVDEAVVSSTVRYD